MTGETNIETQPHPMSPQRSDDPNQLVQRSDEVGEREDHIAAEDRSGVISTPDSVNGGNTAEDRTSFQREIKPHLNAQRPRPEPQGQYFDSDTAPLRLQYSDGGEDPPDAVHRPTAQHPENIQGRQFQTDAAPPQGTEWQLYQKLLNGETGTMAGEAGNTSPATQTPTPPDSPSAASTQSQPSGADTPPTSKKRRGKRGPDSVFDPFLDEIDEDLNKDLFNTVTPKKMLDELERQHPGAFAGRKRPNLLRTLNRYIDKWRKDHRRTLPKRWIPCKRSQVPRKRKRRMAIFPQDHPPGREAQVDFTHLDELGVTIRGKPCSLQLFAFRLSYSGWVNAELFHEETVSGYMQGDRNSFEKLGGVPHVLRSDNRRNAIRDKQPIEAYAAFLEHYGVEPSLINLYRPNENGGVEGENGHFKRYVDGALHFRGSRNFDSEEAIAEFFADMLEWRNGRPEVQDKLKEELPHLLPLPATPGPIHIELERRVQNTSFIDVYSSKYSVPCQALGQWVTVKVYAEHLEVYDEDMRLLVRWDRKHGNDQVTIDPRHFFPDLLKKWGAFERLSKKIKDQMFPTPSFRSAYEKFLEWDPEPEMAFRKGIIYLITHDRLTSLTRSGNILP